MNTRSIHFRLILWYSGLVVAVALVFGAYVYQGVRERLYGEMERTLMRRASQIAENILPHIHDVPPGDIAGQIKEVYSPEANGRFIRILKEDRSIVYISGAPKDGRFNPGAIPVPPGIISAKRTEQLAPDLTMRIVTVPTRIQGESYVVEMGAPTDDIETALHGLVMTLLFGLPVVIMIVSVGGYTLVRRSLQPVEDIRATAQQITFGNLSNRLPVATTGDALEHLSVTLNQMLDRLEDAYEQASRFSADASHELRTPLAILRGELESIVRERELPASLRERVGSVLEETERLSRITESLFTISRLDAGEAQIQHVRFDLAPLVQTAAEQMALLAEVKKIKVRIAGSPAPVMGDPSRIKQIVVNLLDNAIKYTQDGGDISLKVSAAHHKVILEVTDNGAGIAAAALPHIFDRFYRADHVRSREIGGAGLGLSIVRSIVQAHGGSIEIQSIEGKGTACRVELPLANGEAEHHA